MRWRIVPESFEGGSGKGRPMRLYKLAVTIEDVIGHYEDKKRNESAQVMQSIQRLKEISAT